MTQTTRMPADARPDVGRMKATFAASRVSVRSKFAFTNYGCSVGLQAVKAMPERVSQAKRVF